MAPACASTYGSRGDHGRDYRSDSQRRAFASGQSEGLQNRLSDAKKGHRFEFEQHDAYRDADKGYNRRDGDRDGYREPFRKGFVPKVTFDDVAGIDEAESELIEIVDFLKNPSNTSGSEAPCRKRFTFRVAGILPAP